MFITFLSVIAKMWKQPKRPSAGEQGKNIIFIQWNNIQPFKRNEVLLYAIAKMNLEILLVKEAIHKRPYII